MSILGIFLYSRQNAVLNNSKFGMSITQIINKRDAHPKIYIFLLLEVTHRANHLKRWDAKPPA